MNAHTDTARTTDHLYLSPASAHTRLRRYLRMRDLDTLLASAALEAMPVSACRALQAERELQAGTIASTFADLAPDATSAYAAYDDSLSALASTWGITPDRYSYLHAVLSACERTYHEYVCVELASIPFTLNGVVA